MTEYVPNEAKPFIAVGGVLFGFVSAANAVKKEKLELKEKMERLSELLD